MSLTRNQTIALSSYRVDAGQFGVSPQDAGQIVEVSYGCSSDFIFRRSVDKSDRTVIVTAYRHPAEDHDWTPWNDRPVTGRRVGVIYHGYVQDDPSGRQK